MNEVIKPYLSIGIKVCSRCGKIDIHTYARYKLKGDKYFLDSAFSKCQKCNHIEEISKEDLKFDLKN
jgi:hypothetical protein